eukprot:363244-Chlamydomonas_euryale.AAC.5
MQSTTGPAGPILQRVHVGPHATANSSACPEGIDHTCRGKSSYQYKDRLALQVLGVQHAALLYRVYVIPFLRYALPETSGLVSGPSAAAPRQRPQCLPVPGQWHGQKARWHPPPNLDVCSGGCAPAHAHPQRSEAHVPRIRGPRCLMGLWFSSCFLLKESWNLVEVVQHSRMCIFMHNTIYLSVHNTVQSGCNLLECAQHRTVRMQST